VASVVVETEEVAENAKTATSVVLVAGATSSVIAAPVVVEIVDLADTASSVVVVAEAIVFDTSIESEVEGSTGHTDC
jgi:hypothetical protein